MKKKVIIIPLIIIFIFLLILAIISKKNQETENLAKTHFEGLKREYLIHTPQDIDLSEKNPLVIYLHGGGGGINSAESNKIVESAEKNNFILAIPKGTGIFKEKGLTWNAGKYKTNDPSAIINPCCGHAAENNIDDAGFIKHIIDEIKQKHNIDSSKIYITGFSNGAMLAYKIACEYPREISGVIAVAPVGIPEKCNPSSSVEIVHIHGTNDPCTKFEGGTDEGCLGKEKQGLYSANEMVNFWKEKNGCSNENKTIYEKENATCIKYENCRENSNVIFCPIKGMGHTWPSGSQYFSEERIGKVSYEISFENIWELI